MLVLVEQEAGKPYQICKKCSFIRDAAEDNEVLDAKEKALKELAYKEPKLLHLEIRPPLQRIR